VTLDLGNRDNQLMASGWEANTLDPIETDTTAASETSFAERLRERATKQTRLLKGILAMHAPGR